jgi:hypothetical protein
VSKIHDRQAVILEPREYAEWLKKSERPPLHLLRTLRDEDLVIDSLGTQSKTETPEGLLRPRNSVRLIFFPNNWVTPHPMGISSHDGQLIPKK